MDIPAIIRESSALIVSLTGLLIALVSVITTVRANKKTDKKVEAAEQQVAAVEAKAVVAEAKAVVAEAQVAHAVEEVEATRVQQRKMYDFIKTDVFNVGVLSESARTDFLQLEPISKPSPLRSDDGTNTHDQR